MKGSDQIKIIGRLTKKNKQKKGIRENLRLFENSIKKIYTQEDYRNDPKDQSNSWLDEIRENFDVQSNHNEKDLSLV